MELGKSLFLMNIRAICIVLSSTSLTKRIGLLLQELRKSVRDQQRSVDESLDAVGQAGFCLAVELRAGLVAHAFVPTDLVELVNLQ